MGYITKLWHEWYDRFDVKWIVYVSDKTYSGSAPIAPNYISSGDPLVFRYGPSGDLESIIKSTECTLSIIEPNGEDYSWLIGSMQPKRLMIQVLRDPGGDEEPYTWYIGLNISNDFTDDLGYNREYKIVFSDHLNLLQEELYAAGTVGYTGIKTILKQASEILLKTGLTLNINIACSIFQETMISTNNNALAQSYVNQYNWLAEDFSPSNCADVLEKMLMVFGCRIFQSRGEWWICRVRDFEFNTLLFQKYTSVGVFISSSTLEHRIDTSISQTTNIPFIRRLGGELRFLPEWQKRTINVIYGLKQSLVSGLDATFWWLDAFTHKMWTNDGNFWRHIGERLLVNKEFVDSGYIRAYTDDRTMSPAYNISSPLFTLYTYATYTLSIETGKSSSPIFGGSCAIILNLWVEGIKKYTYDDGQETWVSIIDHPEYERIPLSKIKFKKIDTSKSIKTALTAESVSINIVSPPEKGDAQIIILAPWNSHPWSTNVYYYVGGVQFLRVAESDILPIGMSNSIHINEDSTIVPEDLSLSLCGGGQTIERGYRIDPISYTGLISTDDTLLDIDDWWAEIYNMESEGSFKNLTDWLLINWYTQHFSPSRQYNGAFIGALEPTTLLWMTEFSARFIWDDVEFNVKAGIWTGTWLELKKPSNFKTQSGDDISTETPSLYTSPFVGGVFLAVSQNTGDTLLEHRSSQETVDAGEQSILFSSGFMEVTDSDILMDVYIPGKAMIDGQEELIWAAPYDITVLGFKINFKWDCTFTYTAIIKR